MEILSPSLELILEVRGALENGTSIRTAITNFSRTHSGPFVETLSAWILLIEQNKDPHHLFENLHPNRRALLIVLSQGLRGAPIIPQLKDLEGHIIESCELEIEEHIQKLPIKLLLPVLFLMFPAYLLLLLGPLLASILSSF